MFFFIALLVTLTLVIPFASATITDDHVTYVTPTANVTVTGTFDVLNINGDDGMEIQVNSTDFLKTYYFNRTGSSAPYVLSLINPTGNEKIFYRNTTGVNDAQIVAIGTKPAQVKIDDVETGFTFISGVAKILVYFGTKIQILNSILGPTTPVTPPPTPPSTNDLGISWSTLSNPILMDRDNDGMIDTAYTPSSISAGPSPSNHIITFTKRFGTGLNTIGPLNFTASIAGGGTAWALFGVYKNDHIIVAYDAETTPAGIICSVSFNLVNVNNGNKTELTSFIGGPRNNCEYVPAAMERSDNSLVTILVNQETAGVSSTIVQANTTTLYTNSPAISGIVTPIASSIGSIVWLPNLTNQSGTLVNNNGYIYNDTSTGLIAQINMDGAIYNIDSQATHFNSGLKKQNQTTILNMTNPKWPNFFGSHLPTTVLPNEKIAYLNYKILNNALSSEPDRMLLDINGTENIGLLTGTQHGGYTLYYAPVPNLSTYSFQAYLLDDYPPTIPTLSVATPLPTEAITLDTPILSTNMNIHGITGLLSGDKMTVTSVDRSFNAEHTDLEEILPVIIPPTSGLTVVQVEVKNPPNSALIKVESDAHSLFGFPYVWTTKELDTAKAFTIDMPTNLCFNIKIADGTIEPRIWESLGSTCATGLMPKILTYSTNLAFTFWTLPWGTTTTYDAGSDSVETIVRSSDPPADYYVRIYDKNGTIQVVNKYTTSGLDVRHFDLSSIQKPSRVEILDGNNKTLHFATLGTGNYLTQIKTFSDQYLTINGFNLLAMMPLIFAAAWTRNTVGIGSVMTVVFIMTMVWFGILSLPDLVLYLMLFVAAIGMIAYKILY